MKISWLYPRMGVHKDDRNWMYYIGEALADKVEVLHNDIRKDCDFIVGMSISQIENIAEAHNMFPDIPLILYNWDMHPDLQPEVGKWDEIGWDKLLKDAVEVWTQTHYHANLAEEITGIEHTVVPMGAIDAEMEEIEPQDKGYAMMASRRDPYKRFDLFEGACEAINMPYVSRHPNYGDRDDYLETLAGCKVMVIASREEANTPMSGYEAAFLGKPLILTDHPVFREEWGDSATYFKGLEGLKEALQVVDPEMGEKARERANKYTTEAFVDRIYTRLCNLS